MPASPQQLLRQLEHLVPSPAALGESDAILLHRFACGRDEAAFTALVLRHGPMVLGVCRRVLRDVRDAEDVLQATFLILARKAASLSRPEALAAWLHGTAYRLALRCRRADQRRRQHETQAVPPVPVRPPQDPLDDLTARELLAILDEEVQRLPEVYRLPVLLCCLNGHTQEEAARLLGCTPGAVKGRLERGRQSLQQRLARRGLAAPVVFAALELARGLASAAVPAAMAHTITRAASVSLTGGDIIGTGISASAAALAKQALRGGGATLKLGAALLLTLGLLAGAGALTPQQPEAKVPAAQPPDPPRVQGQQGPAADLRNDPLPPGARARLGTVRFRQGGGYVGILLYSPDGKTLASAGYEENIYLWDAVTGQCIRRLAGHKNKCGMIAWSPDGKLLASTGQEYDATIRLWDVATGQLARTINTPKDTHIIAYSPDGKLLASLGRDWLPILWDAATGKEVRRLPKTTHQPCHLSFSCDGKIVAVGSHDGLLRLWETASGKELQRFSCSSGGVVGAAFSADGQLFATGTNGGIVSLWDPTSGKLLRRWPKHEGYASSLAFSADGKILLASWFHSSLLVRRPTSIKLLDTTTGKEVRSLEDCDGCVHAIALAPDGITLAAAEGGCIRRWDITTGKTLPPLDGHLDRVFSLALMPDGKTVFSASADGTIRRWDIATGKQTATLDAHRSCVWRLCLSADGKFLVSGGIDRAVYLWDPRGTKPLREIPVPETVSNLRSLGVSRDGRIGVTSGDGQGLWFWDTATGKELRRIAPKELFFCMAFSPDGQTIATGGYDGGPGLQLLSVWEVGTGKLLGREQGLNSYHSVAFSPDGRWIAAGLDSSNHRGRETLRLYDAHGKPVRHFGGYKSDTWDVAFSPDGHTLASAGSDRTVRLWEVATGQERRRFEGHNGTVHGVAFSADGRTLVSGSADTTLLVWDLDDRARAFRAGKALTAAQLEQRWGELAGNDAPRAYEAICCLTAFPKQTVPLLRDRLLGREQGGDKVATWIRDLDDKRFAVRERAMAKLRNLGRQVEPDLRRALAERPSEETRRRLEQLLESLGGASPVAKHPETLRSQRAVEVLELIGTAEARQLLQALAAGPADSLVTLEARSALQRLK